MVNPIIAESVEKGTTILEAATGEKKRVHNIYVSSVGLTLSHVNLMHSQ